MDEEEAKAPEGAAIPDDKEQQEEEVPSPSEAERLRQVQEEFKDAEQIDAGPQPPQQHQYDGMDAGEDAEEDAEAGEGPQYHWAPPPGEGSGSESSDSEEDDDDSDADAGVPLFANRENRMLHKEILTMDKRIEALQTKLEEDEDRKKALQEHIKSVEQEFKHAEQLLAAKSKELATEEHMRQLAQREAGRLRLEIQRVDDGKEDKLGQLSSVQSEIFKANDQMDKFKLNMNFNQEELEQWTLAMQQNEDDQKAFERYMKADNVKVKELNFQIEKLTTQLQTSKRELDDEVTETQAKQIELDKTAEEFRARHKERQDVLRKWQDAIAQVKARDAEIQRAGEEYARVKDQMRQTRKQLDAEKAFLENLKQDCQDMETKSKMVDHVLQKKRAEEVDAKKRVEDFRAEVELIKTEVSKASDEVNSERQKVAESQRAIEEAKAKLEAARERLQTAKAALEEAKGENSSAELTASAAEEQVRMREAELKSIEARLAALKEASFRESEALFQFRKREADLLAEISGAIATGKNLGTEIQRLDEESLRQKEHVYNAEFQIQQLERKVARANGVRSDEEKKVLNRKIALCQEELDEAQTQHGMLLAQVKNLDDELRTTKRTAQSTIEKREELSSRLNELKLENTSAEKTLQVIMKKKEEVMVSNDLMKLQVKGLRDQLSDRADKVFGLENRKFQLEMSMQERKKEIQTHTDMQRTRAKVAEEERHKVAMEAQECRMKVRRLEKKFATICKSSDEDGGERSQAYFVIAAAQKREELQREGDELDAKIRKATREINALEETLSNINALNSQFRNAAHRADPKSKEAVELRRVYDESKAAKDVAFKRRKELQRLLNDLNEDARRVRQLAEQTQVAEENRRHLESSRDEITQELSEQSRAIASTEARIREHAQQHRLALGLPADTESVHEVLFRVEMNNQSRDSVLYTLGQLTKEFPEMEDDVQAQLTRLGLSIPSAPPRTPGNLASLSSVSSASAGPSTVSDGSNPAVLGSS